MVTLRVAGLSFCYAAHPVFADLSIDITKGDVVSLVGRNGAGKSTLLKCVNHVVAPSAGSVFIDEVNIATMDLRHRALRFGYLAQRNEQIFPVTVFDVVLSGRYPHSPLRFTKKDEQIAAEIITMLELDEFAHRLFNQLSGGEQQQVLIARALAQGADMLLFDEPNNNLDMRHELQIMRLIQSLAKNNGITALLAVHDLNLAAGFSDKIIVLHNGTILAYGIPAEVFTKEIIREAFGVDVKIYDHHGIPHIVAIA